MNKIFVLCLFLATLVTACTTTTSDESKPKSGYIVKIDSSSVTIAVLIPKQFLNRLSRSAAIKIKSDFTGEDVEGKTVEQLVEEGYSLVSLSHKKIKNLLQLKVGQKVSYEVNGATFLSNPGQGEAKEIVPIETKKDRLISK